MINATVIEFKVLWCHAVINGKLYWLAFRISLLLFYEH
jgi:hypothetical protein